MYDYNRLYIDGVWCLPSGFITSDVINPATEALAGRVVNGDETDVDQAVLSARKAFDSWSMTPSEERARYISAIAEGMRNRREELAAVITAELGMPLHLSQEVQVDGPIDGLLTYAALASDMDEVEHVENAVLVKEAIGVCAFINPWNYPLHQLIGKIGPALAAGCTMVVKPSEETPLHAYLLAEIIDEAGLPHGVFNLVAGTGAIVGEALCTHEQVDVVSFTGSTGAGIRVAELAAKSVKRVCQELGGKSPQLITEDADLKAAVEHGVMDVMVNSGQTCTSLSRMLVPESRYQEAIEIAIAAVDSIKVGDPLSSTSFMGPMCSARQRDTVLGYIEQGGAEGARLVVGGTARPEGCEQGFYVKPTIFADVKSSMSIAREEIFGPVLCMIPYQTLEEGIEIANDTEFGLSSAVWASTDKDALKIARQIRAGQVFINGGYFNYSAPFGGYKKSGNGREWGRAGLDEFVERKAMMTTKILEAS